VRCDLFVEYRYPFALIALAMYDVTIDDIKVKKGKGLRLVIALLTRLEQIYNLGSGS